MTSNFATVPFHPLFGYAMTDRLIFPGIQFLLQRNSLYDGQAGLCFRSARCLATPHGASHQRRPSDPVGWGPFALGCRMDFQSWHSIKYGVCSSNRKSCPSEGKWIKTD